jgi:putative N6-adenine-specific DNA methylase
MSKLVIKTLHGLENILAAELEALGGTEVLPLKRAVECTGDKRLAYRICYEARTALRVLVPVKSFKAYNEKDFYKSIQDIEWDLLMNVDDTLAVEAVVAGDVFKHSQYTALLAKDAIVDQFREKYQSRPNVDITSPTLRIHVRVHGTQCDIQLDASGDSLHKRGYRRDSVEAPLNEVLAAGMVLMTGYTGECAFTDPMCGSGTLPIEAAMIAMKQPPQLFRETPFGFTRWKNFDQHLWHEVKKAADVQKLARPPFPVVGTDMNPRAISASGINAMSAGLDGVVHFEKREFANAVPPRETGILIMNPPYDERLRLSEVEGFYKNIGDTFKKNWAGWSAWIISSNKEGLKSVGLRPSRRIPLINGSLDCSFQRFDMYAGKKWSTPVAEGKIEEAEEVKSVATDEVKNVETTEVSNEE